MPNRFLCALILSGAHIASMHAIIIGCHPMDLMMSHREPMFDRYNHALWQNDTTIKITLEVPGYSSKELTMQVSNNGRRLMVTGLHAQDTEDAIRSQKTYYQSLQLPCAVLSDGTSAQLKNGILTITLQKAEINDSFDIQISED